MPSRRSSVVLAAAAIAVASLALACGNTTGLPAASITNVVDTVSLYALRGTDIALPSAYTLEGALAVRTDQTTLFDFAFDFDSIGEPALFPTEPLHLGTASGLQRVTTLFDAITLAPTGPYVFDKPLALDRGTIVLVRSRPTTCVFGPTVSLYAKLRVLAVNSTARRLDFEILVDQNCGYRGLAPGLPKQ